MRFRGALAHDLRSDDGARVAVAAGRALRLVAAGRGDSDLRKEVDGAIARISDGAWHELVTESKRRIGELERNLSDAATDRGVGDELPALLKERDDLESIVWALEAWSSKEPAGSTGEPSAGACDDVLESRVRLVRLDSEVSSALVTSGIRVLEDSELGTQLAEVTPTGYWLAGHVPDAGARQKARPIERARPLAVELSEIGAETLGAYAVGAPMPERLRDRIEDYLRTKAGRDELDLIVRAQAASLAERGLAAADTPSVDTSHVAPEPAGGRLVPSRGLLLVLPTRAPTGPAPAAVGQVTAAPALEVPGVLQAFCHPEEWAVVVRTDPSTSIDAFELRPADGGTAELAASRAELRVRVTGTHELVRVALRIAGREHVVAVTVVRPA